VVAGCGSAVVVGPRGRPRPLDPRPLSDTDLAMSTEADVALIRAALERFNETGEPAWELYAPDVTFKTRGDLGDGEVFRGHEGLGRALGAFKDVWGESMSLELVEVLGTAQPLIAVLRVALRGAKSGVELKVEEAWAIWLRDGKIARMEQYGDRQQALEAAGIDAAGVEPLPSDVAELVRFGYEWVNREREPPPNWHPEGEYINSREDPDHGAHQGIDAIRRQHQSWFEAYPDLRVEPVEIRTHGEKIFVWTHFAGHGADSGAPMEMELAHVVTMQHGLVRRMEEFFDRAEALRVAGLEE